MNPTPLVEARQIQAFTCLDEAYGGGVDRGGERRERGTCALCKGRNQLIGSFH